MANGLDLHKLSLHSALPQSVNGAIKVDHRTLTFLQKDPVSEKDQLSVQGGLVRPDR